MWESYKHMMELFRKPGIITDIKVTNTKPYRVTIICVNDDTNYEVMNELKWGLFDYKDWEMMFRVAVTCSIIGSVLFMCGRTSLNSDTRGGPGLSMNTRSKYRLSKWSPVNARRKYAKFSYFAWPADNWADECIAYTDVDYLGKNHKE
ncbi:hypothetical protein Tco_1315035 [Tanacetum coccineum]